MIGHIKPNCRKWLALQTSEQYKQRNSHETKYQLIYDHLEDSVLAPRLCQYCSDSNCDGDNCESPFDHDDYNEASVFFIQNLSALLINTKLERPLDSHAPQTEQLYMYDNDDWGETYEDESDSQWETQDNSEQYFDTQDAYSAEWHKKNMLLKSKIKLMMIISMRMIRMITCDIRTMHASWMHTYRKLK